ncbi:3-deoxy-manno-octulosonate-8-phosphatase KdsC [Flocculibacter collagenilyticus]|uniref:3-deoxy-manno-octulosonate-8-phosphatase KdsC n=1 Tax=Flocculibacter collagenilyticus TaxID=2744479 RepID=UPI0018F75F8C|nr:3-deoxy-manno-octulosonate-8-phosphatase KdsC [Flocculibacter collagenilyticus]
MNLFETMYQLVTDDVANAAKQVKLVICDVDGVFSDGRIYLGNDGEELKAFHTRDGYGVKALLNENIAVAVITGRNSRIVEKRMTALGVTDIYQGCENKQVAYQELLQKYQLTDAQVAYIGDDFPDLLLIKQVGLGVAVQDAHPLVSMGAKYITKLNGGFGAVRELSDLILISQDKFNRYSGTSA